MQTEQTEPDIEAVKVQYEMDRLKRMDDQNRLRTIKYLKKRQQEGRRQISAIISESTYQEICRLRDKSILEGEPLTAGDIIEIAVSKLSDKGNEINNTFAVNINNEKTEPISDDLSYYHFNKPPLSDKTAYSVWLNGYIMELHKTGLSNLKVMAELEKQGVKTARGLDKWQAGTIGNIIAREKRKAEGVDVDAGE